MREEFKNFPVNTNVREQNPEKTTFELLSLGDNVPKAPQREIPPENDCSLRSFKAVWSILKFSIDNQNS